MARQNVRLPILTIERVAMFFWVSLGLREADEFRVLIVQNFEGVAVEDGGDCARQISSTCTCGGKKKGKEDSYDIEQHSLRASGCSDILNLFRIMS